MSTDEHSYIVAYDIANPARWRRVFGTMKGYGVWLQLSVFQCRLSALRRAEMIATLDQIIDHDDDHIVVMDLGPANAVSPKVTSLGKRPFEPIERVSVVV